MLTDTLYEKCLPVLQNTELDDDDRTEKLEDLVRAEAKVTAKELENTVLDTLWRFRTATSEDPSGTRPSSRHTVIRRASPAPWQLARTPTPASPRPSTLTPSSSAIFRNRSSTASPFASPRASPRLAFVTPYIPHSPRLDAYQPNNDASPTEDYEGLGSDSVEWLVGDDARSNASGSLQGDMLFNSMGPESGQQQLFMDPHDMLRSVFGDDLTNDVLQKSLEDHGYDIAATMSALMEAHGLNDAPVPISAADVSRTILVGKSMSPNARPVTPVGQQRSPIVCRYWLASGNCARADCRFSHDTTGTVCKYWLQGNCLAGDTCAFSHDPTSALGRMMHDGTTTPPHIQPNTQDFDAFPTLQPAAVFTTNNISPEFALAFEQYHGSLPGGTTSTLNPLATFTPSSSSRPHSRTGSRHNSRAPTPSVPAVDDNDAFPTLGSAASAKAAKKHHGKRGGHGHGHAHKESPSSLADVVRMAPPAPSPSPANRRGGQKARTSSDRGLSAAALAIAPPQDLPWVATGDSANKAYVKARAEAFRHAGQRNKLLQGAAQAYNRHDARAAKALSLRGQAENNLMREAHRKAAQMLYDERHKESGPNARELYVDLHGLHAEEAVDYLSKSLREHENTSPTRPIYAITGTGHHSRNGKDKIGKAVRAFLMEWRYAFREFSGPGDRNGMGGVIGIDPSSWDRALDRESPPATAAVLTRRLAMQQSTKLVLLKKEDVAMSVKGEAGL